MSFQGYLQSPFMLVGILASWSYRYNQSLGNLMVFQCVELLDLIAYTFKPARSIYRKPMVTPMSSLEFNRV